METVWVLTFTLLTFLTISKGKEGLNESIVNQRREEFISQPYPGGEPPSISRLEKRGGRFQCKEENERCRHLPPCCGNMTCYRPAGYSLRKGGTCVKCIKAGQACQRDDQCCPHLQCNSGNALWIDGTCEKYRRSGNCYRDGQCVNKCVKEWYQTTGHCT